MITLLSQNGCFWQNTCFRKMTSSFDRVLNTSFKMIEFVITSSRLNALKNMAKFLEILNNYSDYRISILFRTHFTHFAHLFYFKFILTEAEDKSFNLSEFQIALPAFTDFWKFHASLMRSSFDGDLAFESPLFPTQFKFLP